MISNEEKEGWRFLALKKISALLHLKALNHKDDFYSLILSELKVSLSFMKEYVKIKIFVKLQCHQKQIIY